MHLGTDNTAIITGGGSGLGRALSFKLADRGVAVAIADIDGERAEETLSGVLARSPGNRGFAVACDVSSDGDFADLRQLINHRWSGKVDLLVNNAGIAGAGDVVSGTPETWQQMLDINLLGVLRGCREFIPGMQSRGRGHIVNIASFAGIACAPGMAAYNVTKAGVIALSESLRGELQPHGIGVSVACPAFFSTRLMEGFLGPADVAAQVEQLMHRSPVQAEDVARDILAAVEQQKFMVIPHPQARRAWRVKRLFPEYFFRMISRQTSKWQSSRKGAKENG